MVWGSIFQHPFSNPDRLCPEPVPVSGHCAQWQIACSALASSQTGYRVKGLPYQRIAQHLHHSRVVARPWIWFACLDHTHLSVHLLLVVATFYCSWRHAGSPVGPWIIACGKRGSGRLLTTTIQKLSRPSLRMYQ